MGTHKIYTAWQMTLQRARTTSSIWPVSFCFSIDYLKYLYQILGMQINSRRHQQPNSMVVSPFPSTVNGIQPRYLAFSIPWETIAKLPWCLMRAMSDSTSKCLPLSSVVKSLNLHQNFISLPSVEDQLKDASVRQYMFYHRFPPFLSVLEGPPQSFLAKPIDPLQLEYYKFNFTLRE